jgi:hypothetical protein
MLIRALVNVAIAFWSVPELLSVRGTVSPRLRSYVCILFFLCILLKMPTSLELFSKSPAAKHTAVHSTNAISLPAAVNDWNCSHVGDWLGSQWRELQEYQAAVCQIALSGPMLYRLEGKKESTFAGKLLEQGILDLWCARASEKATYASWE